MKATVSHHCAEWLKILLPLNCFFQMVDFQLKVFYNFFYLFHNRKILLNYVGVSWLNVESNLFIFQNWYFMEKISISSAWFNN